MPVEKKIEVSTTMRVGQTEKTVEIGDITWTRGAREIWVHCPETKKWSRGIASMHRATIRPARGETRDRAWMDDRAPKFALQAVANYTGLEVMRGTISHHPARIEDVEVAR